MAKHVITFKVTVTMEDMDGTPEQSAEIALDQVACALIGETSMYGLPWDSEAVVIGYGEGYDE